MWLLAISVWGAPRQATASEAYQQRRERISVSFRNASLAEVLQRIKQQTGYYILYNSDAARGIGGISFSKADAPVREVLDEALRGTRLEYSIDDDTIVIRARSGGGNASAPQKAPDKVVSGRVTDTAGAPLVGVNILIQGTATGVVSGSDGGFSIRMPEGRDNLIFSHIGYVSQTLPSAQTRLVRLVQDEQEIENVVVTGIFTRKKESYTGSATTITSGQLARVSNRNVFESLKNIEPSLYIMDNTLMGSDPNTLPDMQLRGITTFPSESTGVNIKGNYQNRPNQPLFILDGFETTAEKVMDMDMTRIESITILKDAAAKALYGSKAANGVIVIETKRLAGNQELVTYTGSIEVSMPDLTSYNLCNAWEKLEAERIEGVYTSANPQTQVDLTKRYNALKAQVLGGLDTYWLAKPLRTGVGHKHTLSVELGDSRKLRAMIDFSYNNVAGVMKGSERTVLSGDVNVSYRKKSFLFRNILSVSNTRSDNSPWGDFGDYARMNPYWSAVDPQTGQIARWAYDEVANPMYDATLGTLDRETYTSVTNNFYAEWQATEALKLTARLGIAVKRSDADEFYPAKHSKFATSAYESTSMQLRKGSYQLDNGKSSDISGEIYANYAKNWGRHYLYVNAGGRIAENTYSAYQHYAEGFPNSQTADITFARQYAQDKKPVGISSITREISFLGTASYSYDDRYNVDLTFRESASSLYGADNRWSSAWSAGVAWNLHNEPFLRDQDVLKQFKIRASAGLTGNQNLPALRRGIPQQPDGRHHLRPAVRPGQKARRHLVDHARNQFPGNRVVQLRRPLQRRPHVPRKRLVALRRRQPLVVGMERRRGVEPPQRTLPARSGRFETIQDPRLGRTDGQPELRHQRSAGHLSLLHRGHLPRTDGRLPLEDAQPRPQMGTAHGLQRGRRHYDPPRNDRLRLLQLGDREHAHRRGDPHLHGFRHREGQPGQSPQPRHRGQIELYALAGQTGLFQPLRLDRL